MSNIRTMKDLESGPNKEALPNPWNAQRTRSSSGEPIMPNSQRMGASMAYIGMDGYQHTMPQEKISTTTYCCMACCPCCLNFGTSEQKNQFIAMTKSFLFGLSVVQIIIFIAELCVHGFASDDANPMLGPPAETFIVMGAQYGCKERYHYQIWRFIVPVFLHAGFIHIFFNLWTQLRYIYLERRLGIRDTVIIYFVAGIAGNLFTALCMPNSLSVGASGALLGLLGADLSLLIFGDNSQMTRNQKFSRIAMILLSAIIIMVISTAPYINWAAHVGGFIFGFTTCTAITTRKSTDELFKKFFWPRVSVTVSYFILGFALFYTVVKPVYC